MRQSCHRLVAIQHRCSEMVSLCKDGQASSTTLGKWNLLSKVVLCVLYRDDLPVLFVTLSCPGVHGHAA